jgi:hypothetical protein
MIYRCAQKVAQIFSDAFDLSSSKSSARIEPAPTRNKHDGRRTIDDGPEQNDEQHPQKKFGNRWHLVKKSRSGFSLTECEGLPGERTHSTVVCRSRDVRSSPLPPSKGGPGGVVAAQPVPSTPRRGGVGPAEPRILIFTVEGSGFRQRVFEL